MPRPKIDVVCKYDLDVFGNCLSLLCLHPHDCCVKQAAGVSAQWGSGKPIWVPGLMMTSVATHKCMRVCFFGSQSRGDLGTNLQPYSLSRCRYRGGGKKKDPFLAFCKPDALILDDGS